MLSKYCASWRDHTDQRESDYLDNDLKRIGHILL